MSINYKNVNLDEALAVMRYYDSNPDLLSWHSHKKAYDIAWEIVKARALDAVAVILSN